MVQLCWVEIWDDFDVAIEIFHDLGFQEITSISQDSLPCN